MKVIKLELTEERLAEFGKYLNEEYNLDSLDLIETLMSAERIFKVRIPDVGDIEWMEDKK